MTTNEILARKMVEDNKASGMVGSGYEGYLKALNRIERESGPLNNGAVPDSTTNPNWLSDYNAPIIARENRTENDQKIPTSTVLSGETPPIDKKRAEDEGGILSGIRSFTRPIGNYAKELFSDPQRMALITGGLRMADPNSYYDKQGFYSPWGGVNAGVNTGVKTYQTLSEPRNLGFEKQKDILLANAKELASYEANLREQYGTDSKEWATWLQYKKMLPKNKQNDPNEYLKWKRSVPWLNTGPEFVQPLPTDAGGGESRKITKGLNPSEQPSYKEDAATSTRVGTGLGNDIASARSKLPMMELELAEMEALSTEFTSHAGFQDLIGATWKPFAKNIHGSNAAGADSIRKQLEGKLFMKAYQTLKGGGQITEIEGDQAKQAQGRMNIALSEAEYKKALTDFLSAYRRGLENLKKVANQKRREGDSKSRRSTDKITEEERRELEALKLELGKQ